MLEVQALAVVCISFWAISSTFLLLWFVNKITPLRMAPKDEILGADYTEHNIMSTPEAVRAASDSSPSRINEGNEISQRSRFAQSDAKMAGICKTCFIDELATDRSKATARENLAYQHDE